MGEVYGLRPLQMGLPGDDYIDVSFTEMRQSFLESGDFLFEQLNFVPEPESHVESDLVIAGTGRVQLGAGWGPPGEFGLDVHVNILQLWSPDELAGANLGSDFLQPSGDFGQLAFAELPNFLEHGGMCKRALNVVLPEPPIKGD